MTSASETPLNTCNGIAQLAKFIPEEWLMYFLPAKHLGMSKAGVRIDRLCTCSDLLWQIPRLSLPRSHFFLIEILLAF